MVFCQICAANAVWGYHKVRGDEACGGSGSGQKLAMLRKLPEVTCSDLPPLEHGATWCHGQRHGASSGAGGASIGAGPLMAQGPLVARQKGLPH